MSTVIKIGGVDVSTSVVTESVSLSRALTSQVDTISFNIVRKGGVAGGGYKPTMIDTVEMIEDGTTIFGGQIVQMDETVDGADVETFTISAKDYSFDMDRFLIVGTYENMSVNDIIDSMKTNFLPSGYDISNVNCPTVLVYASFNYEYPSKVFQQLAELTNSDWYVDQDKNIFFFLKSAVSAPFNLTDDNEEYYYNSLKIKNNVASIRNSIIVRGGKYIGNETSEKQIADGTTTKFLQAYQYSDVFVKKNGVDQTIGIDFIDDPADFDVLYNFQEKSVSWPDASPPTVLDEIEVGGGPYIPVIIQLKDNASIAEFGEFQFKIVDQSINSKNAAIDRARQEMTEWANEVTDGSFETKEPGLEVGQKIHVDSTIRGINKDFIISRITTRMTNGLEFLHSVTLMTTQTYGIIEFLQKLLLAKDRKDLEINPDEVIESIQQLDDSFTLTDSVGTPSTTTGPYVWGSFEWGFGVWS